ncbi:MAG: hypothetical protein WBD55_10880 [Dehalococcoidia bacterium]
MPKQPSHWAQVLDALFESQQAVIDAVRKSNERGLRFSKRLVSEAEQGQEELARLRQRLTGHSKDGRGLYQESVDLARRAADHSAELAEEFVSATGAAGDELRDTVTAIIHANRSAAQAMIAALAGGTSEAGANPPKKPARRPSTRRRKTKTTREAIERTVEQAAAANNHNDER